jgi:hypothetical protein
MNNEEHLGLLGDDTLIQFKRWIYSVRKVIAFLVVVIHLIPLEPFLANQRPYRPLLMLHRFALRSLHAMKANNANRAAPNPAETVTAPPVLEAVAEAPVLLAVPEDEPDVPVDDFPDPELHVIVPTEY